MLALLRVFLVAASVRPVGSQPLEAHSSKAAMLSWIGKAGLKKSDRRALGYHAKPGDTQVNLYSRDVQAAPMRRMWKLELAIQNGKFRPDETRSGYSPGAKPQGRDGWRLYLGQYLRQGLRPQGGDVEKHLRQSLR